jgi:hypothetical protein
MTRSGEAATMEVPAEAISDNDPASPRFQAGLREDIRKDGRSIAVTPRPVSSHLLASRGIGLARIPGEVESVFKEHHRGLNHDARDFSHASSERFVNVLCDVWQADFSSTPTGTLRPTSYFFPRTLTRPFYSRKTI